MPKPATPAASGEKHKNHSNHSGSMATTLMGEHKDVECSQCGQPYQASASGEGYVQYTNCPTCRFPMRLDPEAHPNQGNFSGDRILVSKFAYEIAEPERWDVIVFKFPGNSDQNYIKRLIGLPGETVRIEHGDVYIRRPGAPSFEIAQRSPDKIWAMLQLVHDNDHQSALANAADWPQRWRDESPAAAGTGAKWQRSKDNRTFTVDAAEAPARLYYRHCYPTYQREGYDDPVPIEPPPADAARGRLITDFCVYNANAKRYSEDVHWVGDVAMEFDLRIESGTGKFTCSIVEAGNEYQCEFDLAASTVSLKRSDGAAALLDADRKPAASLEAASPITGAGSYHIRMANANDAVCVWVDGSPIDFSGNGRGVTQYQPPTNPRPHWSPEDPGDLAPLRIAAEGIAAEVSSLKVLRDVYYIAIDRTMERPTNDYREYNDSDDIHDILDDPTLWSRTNLFASRRSVEFSIGQDEFFPMGDNSPQSLDGRLWPIPPAPDTAVPRRLMIGKAVFVYWPHPWNRPVPYLPNPQKMRLIR